METRLRASTITSTIAGFNVVDVLTLGAATGVEVVPVEAVAATGAGFKVVVGEARVVVVVELTVVAGEARVVVGAELTVVVGEARVVGFTEFAAVGDEVGVVVGRGRVVVTVDGPSTGTVVVVLSIAFSTAARSLFEMRDSFWYLSIIFATKAIKVKRMIAMAMV